VVQPPAPVALPPDPLPQQVSPPYGGLTTPLPESVGAVPSKPKRQGPPRQTVILLLVLLVVVIGGAAYYEIHHNSNSTNNNAPAAGIGTQTLQSPPSITIHTEFPTTPPLPRGQQDAQADLRNLSNSEQTYLTLFNRYTTSSAGLDRQGYRKFHYADAVSLAGVDGNKDYCLVSSAHGKAPFFLYDFASSGLQKPTFPSAKSAERSCTDHAIKTYAHIT
jgi:hypothetical protein